MTLRGFSTAGYKATKTFKIFDDEVIKQDLLNHIMTIQGERPHMPTYGTSIPLMAFKPIDAETLQTIETDLKRVVAYDGRVTMTDYAVLQNGHGLVIVVDLMNKNTGLPLHLTTNIK